MLGCVVSNYGTQTNKKVYQEISTHFKIVTNGQKRTHSIDYHDF